MSARVHPRRAARPENARTDEPSGIVLRAEAIRHGYHGQTIVEIDTVQVRAGEVLAVLGPNGAGKSTLFRLLAGVEPPDEGRITLHAGDEGRGGLRGALPVAGVFQRPYLFSGTVAANVGYGLKARRVPRPDRERRVEATLAAAGLSELAGRRVASLSGGERRRVALARALATRPALLLLDEPTADLDVAVRREFRRNLERLVRRHAMATVLITHDPADAFAIADRIAIMEHGRIVQTGSPDQIALAPATPFAATFSGAELLLDGVVEGFRDGVAAVRLPSGAVLLAAGAPDALTAAGAESVHVAYRPEDVVLAPLDDDALTSARNRFRLRVVELRPAGGLVRVRLAGEIDLIALVTRGSAEALGLAPDSGVTAQIKATALRVFPAGSD